MKKLLLTLVALPAATFAIEASAQTANTGVTTRIANLEARFDAALQAGVLDANEQRTIGRNLSELRTLERRYASNGLTAAERRTLQQRIRNVRDQLRNAGGTGWANRYGWNDRDLDVAYNGYSGAGYTYDQYGRRVATPTVTYDRYGRPMQNNYYGQGGPYEPVYTAPQQSSGIGNIFGGVLGSMMGGSSSSGGVLGSILGNGGLRIGDVISGTIGSVLGGATNYGYQDRSNVYFRSDGQRVYEIDARTNRVIRIHPAR